MTEIIKLFPDIEAYIKNPEVLKLGKQGTKVEVVDFTPENPKSQTPVYLSMGWGGNPKIYEEVLRELGKRSRVLSHTNAHGIDVEGDEFAERRKATTILQVIDNKDITKTDALGYSEGGMNTLIAAFMNPEKFRNIVLVNPAGLIENDSEPELTRRFLKDFYLHLKDAWENLTENGKTNALHKWGGFYGGMIQSITKDPIKALQEVKDMSHFNIRNVMRYLREEYGIKISLIVNKDDSAFPPDRFRDTLEGCYDDFEELGGRHGNFVLDAHIMTEAVINQLNKMETNSKETKM